MSWFLVRSKTLLPDGTPGPDSYATTQDGAAITRDLDNPATDVLYYFLKETGGANVVAQNAMLKPPPRVPSGNLEIAVVEAAGADVADAEVKA